MICAQYCGAFLQKVSCTLHGKSMIYYMFSTSGSVENSNRDCCDQARTSGQGAEAIVPCVCLYQDEI